MSKTIFSVIDNGLGLCKSTWEDTRGLLRAFRAVAEAVCSYSNDEIPVHIRSAAIRALGASVLGGDVAFLHHDIVPGTEESPIHAWFELSYAQYLTVPRLALESMPLEWQMRFASCLEELDQKLDWRPKEGRYWVKLKDGNGRYVTDSFADYRHAQKLPLKESP